jgi:hypothetical protein
MDKRQYWEGFGLGYLTATVVATAAYQWVFYEMRKDLTKLTRKERLKFEYLIDKMGPYTPYEVLEEIHDYLKVELIGYKEGL